jgi:hypothetical protein
MPFCLYPCPCGYFANPTHECTCSMRVIGRCQKRISGPLSDRFDVHTEVPLVDYERYSDEWMGELLEAIQPAHGAAVAHVLRHPAVCGPYVASNSQRGEGCVHGSTSRALSTSFRCLLCLIP